ncbi:MarR family winged helix-turn-helix transcriptional regulator [Sutcliffiella sp. NC1]|uniref:MarR family winged helix-turn-helix transcriptional regulator n=1 Tax=Sutcliffiella sp. NC1 TaxID=3004096 RepID=UPI0022DDACC2|nr:MarR family transcriptional regulator [Sutcliffiella sp. NC1]WBL15909.1 MarR family transcriptional regulator [Sutcliffiella sp. NC1]
MEDSLQLFHKIHQLSRKVIKDNNQILQPFTIYSGQWTVLYVLKTQGTQTISELSDYLSVEAPPMTRMIQRLEKQGYVVRTTGEDKRVKRIQLTEKALLEYPKWEEAIAKRNEEIMSNLSSKEELLTLLNEMLEQINTKK